MLNGLNACYSLYLIPCFDAISNIYFSVFVCICMLSHQLTLDFMTSLIHHPCRLPPRLSHTADSVRNNSDTRNYPRRNNDRSIYKFTVLPFVSADNTSHACTKIQTNSRGCIGNSSG